MPNTFMPPLCWPGGGLGLMSGKGPGGWAAHNARMDPRRRFMFRPSAAQRAVQRPPGALAEAAFEQRCTRCDACVKACPPQVIRRGDGGFPEMHFAQAGCDACGACVRACEPGALQAPAVFEGWVARFSAACLAQRGVECRVCGEACDARAIRFPPRLGQVAQPVLTQEACTGCGACVGGCPTQAISMARG